MALAIYSIRLRFLFSLFANICRGGLNFLTNLLIARFLLPEHYGQLAFLLTSFLAITQLFDQGMTSAFYTFISGQHKRRADYFIYVGWLIFQFLAVIAFIGFVGSQSMINALWNHNDRSIILLAFVAVFIQQAVWWSVVQLGESQRKTILMQFASIMCTLVYLLLIVLAEFYAKLSLKNVFLLMIVVYGVASILMLFSLITKNNNSNSAKKSLKLEIKVSLLHYYSYCKPLFLVSAVTFFYTSVDNWLLNYCAGSIQQGYYQVGSQFSTICLLAATSVLRVFWKEFAVLNTEQKKEQMEIFFYKVFHIILFSGAFTCCFLVFWTKDIVAFILGANYLPGWVVLAVMFFYPVHQGIGQLLGASFSATSRTRAYAGVSIPMMLISIPISYFALAPHSATIPGLGLGAIGLALKMVILNILSVNLGLFVFCRLNHWKYNWHSQFICIITLLLIGYISKELSIVVCSKLSLVPNSAILLKMICGAFFYGVLGLGVVLWQPKRILNMDRKTLLGFMRLKV